MTTQPKIVQSFNYSYLDNDVPPNLTNLFPKQVTAGNYLIFYVEGIGNTNPPAPSSIAGYPSIWTGNNPSECQFFGGIATKTQPVIENPNQFAIAGFEISGYSSAIITAIPGSGPIPGTFQSYTQNIPTGDGVNLVLVFAKFHGILVDNPFSVVSPTTFTTLYVSPGGNEIGNSGHVILEATDVPVGNTVVNFGSETQKNGYEYYWNSSGDSASIVIL